jgi:hypothetical protein
MQHLALQKIIIKLPQIQKLTPIFNFQLISGSKNGVLTVRLAPQ